MIVVVVVVAVGFVFFVFVVVVVGRRCERRRHHRLNVTHAASSQPCAAAQGPSTRSCAAHVFSSDPEVGERLSIPVPLVSKPSSRRDSSVAKSTYPLGFDPEAYTSFIASTATASKASRVTPPGCAIGWTVTAAPIARLAFLAADAAPSETTT